MFKENNMPVAAAATLLSKPQAVFAHAENLKYYTLVANVGSKRRYALAKRKTEAFIIAKIKAALLQVGSMATVNVARRALAFPTASHRSLLMDNLLKGSR